MRKLWGPRTLHTRVDGAERGTAAEPGLTFGKLRRFGPDASEIEAYSSTRA